MIRKKKFPWAVGGKMQKRLKEKKTLWFEKEKSPITNWKLQIFSDCSDLKRKIKISKSKKNQQECHDHLSRYRIEQLHTSRCISRFPLIYICSSSRDPSTDIPCRRGQVRAGTFSFFLFFKENSNVFIRATRTPFGYFLFVFFLILLSLPLW